MSDTNNKIVDIDGVELEIGCRVAFAINNRAMRIGYVIEMEPYNLSTNNGKLKIRVSGTNRIVNQYSGRCCRLRNKREE